ncbi:MAG: hypothetical protein COA53_10110 [Rhodobacteraceae bacterium]|nr:MAG: hypothetical protein COA53_10110 [Paracoccaceae bacterium]
MTSKLLGQKLTNALNYKFSGTFRYQFVLSPTKMAIPEFNHRCIGSTNLYTCPYLPVCEIMNQAGEQIGLILGYAVDRYGMLIKGAVSVTLPNNTADAIAAIQGFLTGLAGRYVVLVHLFGFNTVSRIYPDTASSLSFVYDPKTKIVASSLLLCLNRDIEPNECFGLPASIYSCKDLRPFLPDRNSELSDGGFNFGHTPDRHIMRIIPNHYLDLNNFETCRYWPMHEIVADLTVEEAATIIVDRLRLIMRGLITNLDGYLAISGGRDSRVLLACAPGAETSRMRLYTYATNWMTTLDVKIAQVMADAVGQEIIVQIPPDGPKGNYFPRPKRSARYAQRFALSSGLFGIGDDWWKRGYAKGLDNGAMWVRGNFLEILTARFWPRKTLNEADTMLHLMGRAGVGIHDENYRVRKLGFLEDWVSSFNVPIEGNLHDLSYQELALGSSQPFFYGLNEQFYIGPASDRVVFETAMRVAPGVRKKSELYDEVIRQSNPALLELPLAKQIVFQARKVNVSSEMLLEERLEAYRAKYNISN